MRRAQEKLFEGQNLMKSNIGAIGEHTAEVFLVANGCALLARNYACRFGEIDRIMRDDRYIIFAEVKTRAAGAPVSGEEAVDARKQEKLRKTALLWLSTHPTQLQPRFDVLVVEHNERRDFRVVNHIPNAF